MGRETIPSFLVKNDGDADSDGNDGHSLRDDDNVGDARTLCQGEEKGKGLGGLDLMNSTGVAMCWGLAGDRFPSPLAVEKFNSITSGRGFACGILSSNSRFRCWGINKEFATDFENEFRDILMNSLVAGDSHACGFNIVGLLICKGRNDTGQIRDSRQLSAI
ncbi:hypothetical protein NE237_012968 [Protea cynaroides]|uniref:non-specific serine/threonine protein kinase n=1 Tax=Protea cynaroides TaxID=273540 RepID=A0A9Q0H143_9MAGN|nr:hypothetical protein NE237_012968 [Protea cynaroides]